MIEVPPSMRDITGGDYDSEGTMVDFFLRVKEHICREKGIDESKYPPTHFFEIRRKPMQMSEKNGEKRDLDDRINALVYQDRIVACMIETRTTFNYVQYDYFLNVDGLEDPIMR